jgi:hypothetical protein
MDKKLVEEYLNKNSHIVDEKVVVKSIIDYGYDISANITWETEEALHENNVTISLFDLMVFIYSKIQ